MSSLERDGASLNDADLRAILERLDSGAGIAAAYRGDGGDRQPVHTVYGGAHLFTADVARKLGDAAFKALKEYAPDPATLARVLGLPDALAPEIHRRVVDKLTREPVEDHRLDFEDGYGHRPDAEEDGHATSAAHEMAQGLARNTLPPFIGIRIKPLNPELRTRALRTLDRFVTAAVRKAGALPPNFAVTLPKITSPAQVEGLVQALERIERKLGLKHPIPIELMIETPQSILDPTGRVALPALVAAAAGRCRGAHFGTYDYTASLDVTAAHQTMSHPACEFALRVMQVSLAGSGVRLSDGSTTLLPVAPHRGASLTPAQVAENRNAVHAAWRMHYDDVRRSLRNAYYQGWDLHPAQLVTRYTAVFAFFLEGRDQAAARLRAFVDKAAQATLLGNVFDDAATGQGLLRFFIQGLSCGALTEAEALESGLTLEELRGKSFVKILEGRNPPLATAPGTTKAPPR